MATVTQRQSVPLRLDVTNEWVWQGEQRLPLTPKAFAVLRYLVEHPGRVVTKTMILEHIFDYSFDPQTNVVDVLVHRVRGKVDPERTMIQTIRGVGYVLRPG